MAKNVEGMAPYLLLAVILKFVIGKIPALSTWGMAVTVGLCIALGYVLYKRDCKKDAETVK